MIHETPCGQLWPCHALGEEGQGFDPPPPLVGGPFVSHAPSCRRLLQHEIFENFAKNHSLKFSKIFKNFRLRFFAKFSKISGCDFLLNFGIRSISRAFTARRGDTRDGDFYSIVLIFCAPAN